MSIGNSNGRFGGLGSGVVERVGDLDDRHDREAQRRLLRMLYGDLGWEVPRLLTELNQAEDLYLDSIGGSAAAMLDQA